jgi:predicted transcriptional regulator
MKQILLELPDEIAEELERVAPARRRARSAFLRDAVRKALDEVAEAKMAAAYRAQPDDLEPRYFHPDEWEPSPAAPPARPARRRRR